MPSINYFQPPTKSAFVKRLTETYGELCSAANVARILGLKSYKGVYSWLKKNDVPAFDINGRKRWQTEMIAKRIWEAKA